MKLILLSPWRFCPQPLENSTWTYASYGQDEFSNHIYAEALSKSKQDLCSIIKDKLTEQEPELDAGSAKKIAEYATAILQNQDDAQMAYLRPFMPDGMSGRHPLASESLLGNADNKFYILVIQGANGDGASTDWNELFLNKNKHFEAGKSKVEMIEGADETLATKR